jgi:hypothetical protein
MGRRLHLCVVTAAFAAAASATLWTEVAAAHSVKQKVGAYNGSDGTARQRLSLDLAHERETTTVGMTVMRDTYQIPDLEADEAKYAKDIYGDDHWDNQQVNVTATQTWERLTELRVMGGYATDGHIKSRTWATGVSQWMLHETVRVGFDLSRTVVDQPYYPILDYDSVEVATPAKTSSTGATVSVRHLATPTTIVDYSATRVAADARPVTNAGTVAVRQFVTPLDGAVHASATRADNRGAIGEDTTYGSVDAWIAELGWFQNLWRGGIARLGHRWYREDETTRAYEDHEVYGSDLTTFGVAQEFPKGTFDRNSTPIGIEASTARYANNRDVSARSYEVGLTAKF